MYDSNASAITNALTSTSTEVFTEQTISQILSLVTSTTDTVVVADQITAPASGNVAIAAGTEVAFVTVTGDDQATVNVTGDAKVVLFQGANGVDATFGSANTAGGKDIAHADETGTDAITRVVVGTAGADKITLNDGKNTQVIAGDKDEVIAGSGHDVIVAAQGSSTVTGGGHTIVQAVGTEKDFTITTDDGHAVIANSKTGVSVDITNVHFVDLDGTDALIFADDTNQADVANLYHAVFGRNADAAGLDYWFSVIDGGASVKAIAEAFLASDENVGGGTDTAFVEALYTNVLGRAADTAGADYWIEALTNGATRADVIVAFAEVATNHVDANEVTVVGSVTVIDTTA